MNILMVEDHRLVADAMQVMLTEIDSTIRITACYSTQHALSVIDSGKRFELVLTDLFMPGIDGIGLLVGLRNRDKRVPVVVISGSDDDKYIRTAMENGASGFIPKTLPAAEMIGGIRKVLDGGSFFPERFEALDNQLRRGDMPSSGNQNASALRPGLKQLQVLQLMADGNSNKQISQIVGISEATVKYHTSQLFKLLGVKNRTSCVREAQQRGLINSFEDATNEEESKL
ncbi:response regulator transcription factor [Granulosicoccus antarcticus]|uniref:Transcriptional regulatory protein DegU n=1 Tax=Granulosicoccus antarcticus IMCC3135 TaxID=1192854 RepID=A0A2Z2NUV4_9GAMM|nr:response regulator transcription factor [Granulosicoccus antarcticus]ASJ72570.1 Transcriptional regulatory protein DegU [Granulosicoccus antarcticus IMCC3135]